MTKQCPVCHHTGELTWRDGKYYCAMCGTEISEKAPQVQSQRSVGPAVCPICRNRENNQFDGAHYRCALCGTTFDLQQKFQPRSYKPSDPSEKKPRRFLKALANFCFFCAAIMVLLTVFHDFTAVIGGPVYGIFGTMFLLWSKTPRGSKYLLGKEKGMKIPTFISLCIFLIFAVITAWACIAGGTTVE